MMLVAKGLGVYTSLTHQCRNGTFVPLLNPSVPDAQYSERQGNPFSLQIQRLEINLKLQMGIFIFCTLRTNGLINLVETNVASSQDFFFNPLVPQAHNSER